MMQVSRNAPQLASALALSSAMLSLKSDLSDFNASTQFCFSVPVSVEHMIPNGQFGPAQKLPAEALAGTCE